ncbi:SRPBCC domain-containing protein [Nonomuraea pusilla]|uniref:Activator of Hsp90 ATPase homolog 1-like protein n=1 Tax=Nonomuraea pusilla TaxID=46177 RepID=A0A1H7J7K1_9ACTN|nr:SRPBCC domain-containing protein [Nonomuraea pusilla]SEK70354.1 Activator of Hsp90 ATPase homolog 1-like protein [Nonomuraea pusilla]
MSENPTTITAQPGSPFIEVVRDFDATPAQLFRAYTDPELVTRWLGPRGIEMRLIEHDARPGGTYRYAHRDREGDEHVFHGVFHTVTPDERITRPSSTTARPMSSASTPRRSRTSADAPGCGPVPCSRPSRPATP